MDGPVFDAMLKTALEEAALGDLPEQMPPVRTSRHHRRRMRKMLADPVGYYRRAMEEGAAPRRLTRRVGRYVAAAVLAALLTGTVMGYALSGGAVFQKMFDSSAWAAMYGSAADTDQLLEMGGTGSGTVVEDETLRLEILDVVSDGQYAMVSVRLTVRDTAWMEQVLETCQPGDLRFFVWDVQNAVSGDLAPLFGMSSKPWTSQEELAPYQYSLIFSVNDRCLEKGGRYEIVLENFGPTPETCLPGRRVLEVTFPPGKLRTLAEDLPCQVGGEACVLEEVTVSALALNAVISGSVAPNALEDPVIHLKNGKDVGHEGYACGIAGDDEGLKLSLEFQMPLDVDQIDSVTICGQKIPVPEA